MKIPSLFFLPVCIYVFLVAVPAMSGEMSRANFVSTWEGDENGRSEQNMVASCFRLKGVFGAVTGQSASSSYRCSAGYYRTIEIDRQAPPAVTDLFASPTSGGDIQLGWTEVIDDESFTDGYRIYRSVTEGQFSGNAVAEVEKPPFVDSSGLIYGVIYYYRVQAIDVASNEKLDGNSSASALSKSLSTSINRLNVESKRNGEIRLNWSAIAGASFYRVYRSTSAGEKGVQVSTDGHVAVPGYTDGISSGLSEGTRYYYTVQVVDSGQNEQAKGNIQVSALCDATPPNVPLVQSPTHKPGVPSFSNAPEFTWIESSDLYIPPSGGSGISGYYYCLDRMRGTGFNAQAWNFTPELAKTYTGVEDGNWWFHIVAVDASGNISNPGEFGIVIRTSGAVSGKIIHPDTGIAWSGCHVLLLENQKTVASAKSDASGYYSFNAIAFGHYTIKILPVGFRQYMEEVDLTKDNTPLFLTHIPASDTIISKDEAASYPNPARGNRLTFVYWVEKPSGVRIEVFNLNAEPVAVLEERKNGPEFAETSWDISGTGQGIYFYRIRLTGDDGKITGLPVKKLAVIKQ